MSTPEETADPLAQAWVISVLIANGSAEAVVTAEGRLRTALYEDEDGLQPILSTLSRFNELPPEAQAAWRLAMEQDASS